MRADHATRHHGLPQTHNALWTSLSPTAYLAVDSYSGISCNGDSQFLFEGMALRDLYGVVEAFARNLSRIGG